MPWLPSYGTLGRMYWHLNHLDNAKYTDVMNIRTLASLMRTDYSMLHVDHHGPLQLIHARTLSQYTLYSVFLIDVVLQCVCVLVSLHVCVWYMCMYMYAVFTCSL